MLSSPQSAALFNNGSIGIIVVDTEGNIDIINPFALKLFGCTSEELLGKPIELLIPQRYHHRHVQDRQGYMHNPRSRAMGLDMDLYAIKKDGTEFPVEVSLSNYTIAGKMYIIAFVIDITRRKEIENAVSKAKDPLLLITILSGFPLQLKALLLYPCSS